VRVVTVVGARPQFIKLAPLSRLLRGHAEEILVHTGQHYDPGLSQIFFDELELPAPDHHLGVGSGHHGAQTAAMLAGLEPLLLAISPAAVIVFGDTNSTLAGALAAAKLGIPVAHVEAGLRSFDRLMPEETNRVVADHLASWLFAPSEQARRQLTTEGIIDGVHVVGDIMLDAVHQHVARAAHRNEGQTASSVADGGYILATVHRAANTDDPERLRAVFTSLASLDLPVVLPLHPRTAASLERFGIGSGGAVRVCEPVGYLSMLRLIQGSVCVVTDSGGLQKEAFYLRRPCVTLRSETEWPETVASGWNRLVDATVPELRAAVAAAQRPVPEPPDVYGDGRAAERIAGVLLGDLAG
jgi:UDP-GlcNAc3NAcA epimerase